jgi:hypothetical protein
VESRVSQKHETWGTLVRGGVGLEQVPRLRKIIRVAGEELPRGLKPGSFGALYAALKRRSSTGLHGFVAACLHD